MFRLAEDDRADAEGTASRESSRCGWVFTFAAAAYNLVRMRNLGKSMVQSA